MYFKFKIKGDREVFKCFQCGTKSCYLKNQTKLKGKSTTQETPRWSPTKVLTLPNTA